MEPALGFGYTAIYVTRGHSLSARPCHPTAIAQGLPQRIVDNLFLGVNPIETFITEADNRGLRKKLSEATITAVVDKTADGFSIAIEFNQKGICTCTLDIALNEDACPTRVVLNLNPK